ncbi:MAG: hypothetical protein KJO29_14305 [Bacteroidia bacterium]|nr:hypothetical protein [Bacteroidia bacterium]
MELICESGATKSNWVFLNRNKVLSNIQLEGMNLTASPSSISVLDAFNERNDLKPDIVHFYSAGIYGRNVQELLKNKFHALLPGAEIYMYSDIIAASRAVSHGNTSIVSILGTGSNSVLFDGEKIVHAMPSLGYILGDIGSGFHIGKLIVNAFYLGKMRPADETFFSQHYIRDKSLFKKEIYESEKPNTEIARFSYFLESSSMVFRKKILEEAFDLFFQNLKAGLKNSNNYKLNFVGSIASVFQEELIDIANKYNYQIKNIVKDPLEGLIRYHQSII